MPKFKKTYSSLMAFACDWFEREERERLARLERIGVKIAPRVRR